MRTWIAALLLTITLAAILLPLEVLVAPGWASVITGGRWTPWRLVLSYLVGIAAAAAATAFIGSWMLHGAKRGSRWERFLRFAAQWMSMTGLSPLQPAVATVLILGLLPLMMAMGTEPVIPPTRLVTVTTVVLFALALGAETSLRTGGDSPQWHICLTRLGSVLSDMSAPLTGRLVMLFMPSALIFAAAARWQPPVHRVIASPNGREIVSVALGMLAITFLVSFAASRLEQNEGGGTLGGTSGPSLMLTWTLVAFAFLLPLLGTLISADPLRMDVTRRLAEAEGLLSSWGSDELGRDLRGRLFGAWWNSNLHAVLGAAIALVLALPLHAGGSRGCSLCTNLTAAAGKIPPPVLFFAGWGLAWGITGPNLAAVAAGTGLALVPTALRLLSPRRNAAVIPAALALSSMLLMLGWELTLGLVGFVAPPGPSFGTIIGSARQHLGSAPWLIGYSAGVFLLAAVLGVTSLYGLTATYRLPRRTTLLRG